MSYTGTPRLPLLPPPPPPLPPLPTAGVGMGVAMVGGHITLKRGAVPEVDLDCFWRNEHSDSSSSSSNSSNSREHRPSRGYEKMRED